MVRAENSFSSSLPYLSRQHGHGARLPATTTENVWGDSVPAGIIPVKMNPEGTRHSEFESNQGTNADLHGDCTTSEWKGLLLHNSTVNKLGLEPLS